MLQVTQIAENAFHAENNDVKNCEAIVFAEAVRTGKTMLQVIHYVLEEDDSDTNLLCACETLQEEIVKTYKKVFIESYLEDALYDVQNSN
jgi:phage terminase large subunit GpA-like protein